MFTFLKMHPKIRWVRFRYSNSLYLQVILCTLILMVPSLQCVTILNKSLQPKLNDKMVVLTFDDGPNDTYETTARLLEVLNRNNVRAYFCLVLQNCLNNKALVKEIFRNNHVIVSHGNDDKSPLLKSNRKILDELQMWNSGIREITGDSSYSTVYYRPAYGFIRPSTIKMLKKKNVTVLPVTFYAFDAHVGPSKKSEILKLMVEKIRREKHAVVVIHDGKDSIDKLKRKVQVQPESKYNRSWIPELTDSLITILKRDGYAFTLLE